MHKLGEAFVIGGWRDGGVRDYIGLDIFTGDRGEGTRWRAGSIVAHRWLHAKVLSFAELATAMSTPGFQEILMSVSHGLETPKVEGLASRAFGSIKRIR